MNASANILDLIGNTPLLECTAFDTGPCKLFLKLENQNPGGSIKDRIGLSMIEAAERDGRLESSGIIVEATAGNTGLGLALVAAQKSYRLILVIPDKMSREKVSHLRALGAEVVLTRSDVGKGDAAYYQDLAERIAAETPGSIYINQFNNPANPLAHETTTGPEIFAQLGGRLDAVSCGVGSGGTLTGLSRFFARQKPDVEMILADPVGSVLAPFLETGRLGAAGSWFVEGIGEDFIPSICELSRVKCTYSISDEESFSTARELLRKQGVLGGSSTGTLLAAALRYCREQTVAKNVVTFVCDSGNKYLSKMYNDFWMEDQGFLRHERVGDLRDLISHRYQERAVVSLSPDDTLLTAFSRMRLYDISQLPVLAGDRVVGIIDESDILVAVSTIQARFRDTVKTCMTSKLVTTTPGTDVAELYKIFDAGYVAIIADENRFYGLITKTDLINYLRQKLS